MLEPRPFPDGPAGSGPGRPQLVVSESDSRFHPVPRSEHRVPAAGALNVRTVLVEK